jgi:hypothetical protein
LPLLNNLHLTPNRSSLVVRYLDNVHKAFASALCIILVVLATVWLFSSEFYGSGGGSLGPLFLLGSATVCIAAILYNSVNE